MDDTDNPPAGHVTKDDLGKGLRDLGTRKALLQRVIEIAQNVERIQNGLQAVLLLGGEADDIPPQSLRFFEALSERIKEQPTTRIRENLRRLESLIKDDLDRMLALADADEESPEFQAVLVTFGDSIPDVPTLLNEFRRRAQTAVSLRVLLRKRGAPTGAMVLPVSEQLIRRRIGNLEARERHYVGRIQSEITVMQQDVDALLANPACPEGVRRQLEGVRRELQQNLEHIRFGRSVEDLPHPMESITDRELQLPGTSAPAEPAPAGEMPAAGGGEPPAPAPVNNEGTPVAEAGSPRRGILGRLWVWVTTPPSVTWERTRTWRRGRPGGG